MNLSEWTSMVEALRNPKECVKIALVGKYVGLRDAYLSVAEALKHGGILCDSAVEINGLIPEQINRIVLTGCWGR